MTAVRPLKFRWNGESMVPLVSHVARDLYEPGRAYWLKPWEPASSASRRHYHAVLNEGWNNLPERVAPRFPSSEHLRKYLLMRTGHRKETFIATESNEAALQVATGLRAKNEFAIVQVRDTTVVMWEAKSQSDLVMDKAEFERSKNDVLDSLAEMIGVERQTLDRNAGRAA